MSKKKIKIKYIIFVLIIIGIVVFVGKITKLDDLNAEKENNRPAGDRRIYESV